jgi:hypothetical protein
MPNANPYANFADAVRLFLDIAYRVQFEQSRQMRMAESEQLKQQLGELTRLAVAPASPVGPPASADAMNQLLAKAAQLPLCIILDPDGEQTHELFRAIADGLRLLATVAE